MDDKKSAVRFDEHFLLVLLLALSVWAAVAWIRAY